MPDSFDAHPLPRPTVPSSIFRNFLRGSPARCSLYVILAPFRVEISAGDEVRYPSHILTRQPLGWPTVECSRFN
jgi:hypothetical protein